MAIKSGNVVQAKAGSVAYTDTTAKVLFTLPANAMVIRVTGFGTVASGGTSGTYTVKSQPVDGSSAAATLATIDAYDTTIDEEGYRGKMAGIAFARQAVPQYISVVYANGTGSAAAGAATVLVEYL
jgi:hypothetical protein